MRIYSSKEILQLLLKNGWIIKNQRGSHVQLIHLTKSGKVTVPHPRKVIDPKTVKSIEIQAKIEIQEEK
jgi:predicted RNA binding protein YcfA (HicA-like mRNA interferase family)